MLKIPIEFINQKGISIDNKFLYLNFRKKSHKITLHKIPFYSEISRVESKEDKIAIIHFLLTNSYTGLRTISNRYATADPILEKVVAKHDPSPDNTLLLFPYDSLQSVQWHLVSHGIADYWLNPDEPYLTSGIIPEDDMESVWNNFVDKVKCERWGMNDLPFQALLLKKEWDSRIKTLQKKFNKLVNGCYNCINEQGAEKFITCCEFFDKYRIGYLRKLRRWIIETIQDELLVSCYAAGNSTLPYGKVSSRKHIHLTKRGVGALHAYVIDQEEIDKINVYRMIFRLQFSGGGIQKYSLRTVYGIAITNSREEAKTFIKKKVRGERKRFLNKHFCHTTNWDATIQDITH